MYLAFFLAIIGVSRCGPSINYQQSNNLNSWWNNQAPIKFERPQDITTLGTTHSNTGDTVNVAYGSSHAEAITGKGNFGRNEMSSQHQPVFPLAVGNQNVKYSDSGFPSVENFNSQSQFYDGSYFASNRNKYYESNQPEPSYDFSAPNFEKDHDVVSSSPLENQQSFNTNNQDIDDNSSVEGSSIIESSDMSSAQSSTFPNKNVKYDIPNKPTHSEEEVLDSDIKFLVDPSPINLPKEECITEDGELGLCQSAYDCGFTNGVINGLCHQGMDQSLHYRICCIYPSYCGYETNHDVTYFKNPDYPRPTLNNGFCHYRVRLLEGVCQLRVDFVDFSMKPKSSGRCESNNRLTITANTKRSHVPVSHFCDNFDKDKDITGSDMPHLYIHVDDLSPDSPYVEAPGKSTPYVDFKVKVTDFNSTWNLRISQVMCNGASLQAPQGCTQYYTRSNGTIKDLSFAQLDDTEEATKLSTCVRMDHEACAIKYKINEMDIGQVKNKKAGKSQLGYGLTCSSYLIFNGQKSGICGAAENKEVIIPSQGPQGFTVVHEANSTKQCKLNVDYEYLYGCDSRTNYFKYPSPKM